MFISALELLKIGIGPSSSHTMGPMVAANHFQKLAFRHCQKEKITNARLNCILQGSLAFTGRGHATDSAVILGFHGYLPDELINTNVATLVTALKKQDSITIDEKTNVQFDCQQNIVFDTKSPLPEHPNAMTCQLLSENNTVLLCQDYFSIGGGFIQTLAEFKQNLTASPDELHQEKCPYPFASAKEMLKMSGDNQLSIAALKRKNEQKFLSNTQLNKRLDNIWQAMQNCTENGLKAEGILPGSIQLKRRAKALHQQLQQNPDKASLNDWLCTYAMAVNEENAAGHMVVTAPTNGAAGVIPAVLYHFVKHEKATKKQIYDFLLTATAIGGIIKHNGSISGAEVGCQGEVGSAAAMAAAGLCAGLGGSAMQIENAAEIALEHHLGMTCDPVNGLVQVPCIERNGFGAIKAHTAAMLALRGDGEHFMPLDSCIAAMRQTGLEMSHKFKETSLGGLAVSYIEC